MKNKFKQAIEDLVLLSDDLDRRGFSKVSDKIDSVLSKLSQEDLTVNPKQNLGDWIKSDVESEELIIPEDELDLLNQVYKSLKESLDL